MSFCKMCKNTAYTEIFNIALRPLPPSLQKQCRYITFQLFSHYCAEWVQLLSLAILVNSQKIVACCFFSQLFTLSIWQSNFTESASGLRSCWLDHPNWSVFRTPCQKGTGHSPMCTPQCSGCWRCHLISSLRWQEALIYGTQEPFFKPHIWSFPDAQTDEHTLPWLSREPIEVSSACLFARMKLAHDGGRWAQVYLEQINCEFTYLTMSSTSLLPLLKHFHPN